MTEIRTVYLPAPSQPYPGHTLAFVASTVALLVVAVIEHGRAHGFKAMYEDEKRINEQQGR